MPTLAVHIEFEDVTGGELIPLDNLTVSLPQKESSLSAYDSLPRPVSSLSAYDTLPKPVTDSLEASPLLSPSTADKRKGKPHRERASSRQVEYFDLYENVSVAGSGTSVPSL